MEAASLIANVQGMTVIAVALILGMGALGTAIGFALLVVGLFVAVTGWAMATGHWSSSLGRQDYLRLVPAVQAEGQRPD